MIIFPVTTLRVALRAVEKLLHGIARSGHQRDFLDTMMTRTELYDVLKYTGFEERDRKYFGG